MINTLSISLCLTDYHNYDNFMKSRPLEHQHKERCLLCTRAVGESCRSAREGIIAVIRKQSQLCLRVHQNQIKQ